MRYLASRFSSAFLSLLLLAAAPTRLCAFGGPPAPIGFPNTNPYRTMTTANSILVIPVQFPGGASNPLTQAAGETVLGDMDTWVRGVSFGNFGFTTKTVTTTIVMPQAKSYYTTNGFDALLADARTAAKAVNPAWDHATFNFYVVLSESGTLGSAGTANQGNKGMWLPNSGTESFPKSSFAHELAHNLGLNHAGLWIRPSGSSNPLAPTGTFQDYGSLFDPVGLAGYDRHYSAHYKYLLGWLPTANVSTVDSTTPANIRIYAHDGGSLNPARIYAIRIPASVSDAASPGSRDIWLETRTIFNSGIPSGSRDGLIVQWGDQVGSENGSCLIDTTPNSLTPNNAVNDFADALLPVGTTFADPWQAAAGTNRIAVTPVASGGNGADKWVDVAITTPNADLSGLTFSAGALSPAFSRNTASYTVSAVGATSTTVTATAAGAGATLQMSLNGGAFTSITSGTASSPLALFAGLNSVALKVTNGGWTKTYTTTISTALQVAATPATLGNIPDGVGSPTEGPPLDVQFNVSGMSGSLAALVVEFTGAHRYGTDAIVKLISPGGITHTVMNLAHLASDNSTLGGTYTFADDATGPISTAFTAATGDAAVATGRFRTQNNSSTATAMIPVFSGLSGAALNGTWKLRFTDLYSGDTGSISAANIYLVGSASNDANLAALTTTAGALTPAFAAGTTSYTASVPNATTSVTVTPTRAQSGATIQARANGSAYLSVASGSASSALALNVGTNPIDVKVTAEDGTTVKTYTITVARAATPVAPANFNFTRNGANHGFGFTSVTGLSYTLWQSDTMAPGTWTNTGEPAIPGDGTAKSFSIPAPNTTAVPKRFYRVQAQ